MDILKGIKEGKIEFTKEMDDKEIYLDLYTTKQYTLHQLAFFLSQKQRNYNEYLDDCKKLEIQPIAKEDTESITDYITNYQIPSIVYGTVCYKAKKNYSFINDLFTQNSVGIETKNKQYYIVLPESVNSLININNIKELLINKRYKYIKPEDILLSDDSVQFTWCKRKFTAITNIDHFTSEDWNSIACIFMDGSRWQAKHWAMQNLVEIFNTYPCFYVQENQHKKCYLDGYNINRILVNRKTCFVDESCEFERKVMDYVKK